MPKKSNIWELFERTDANHAKCNESEKELVSKSGITSCLLNHLKGQHTQAFLAYERLNDQQNVLPRGHISNNDSAGDEFISSPKRARIVTAAGSYLQTSISSKGKYIPVSSSSLSHTRTLQLYQFISNHVKKIVDEKNLNLDGVAFTTDIWTSATNVAFQSLTFHIITG